jgi:hypothetical protein
MNKPPVEPRKFRKTSRLVNSTSSFCLVIDLLQSNQIRRTRLNHFGLPDQIHFAINAFSMVNVVTENSQRLLLR